LLTVNSMEPFPLLVGPYAYCYLSLNEQILLLLGFVGPVEM